jgi:hypothetical protein
MLLYPVIILFTYRAYRRAIRKNTTVPVDVKKKIFKENFLLQINPKVLIDGHLFVEFEKYCELDEVAENANLFNKHTDTEFET